MEVKAGTEECFYETIKAGETLDVEYQVRDKSAYVSFTSPYFLSFYNARDCEAGIYWLVWLCEGGMRGGVC